MEQQPRYAIIVIDMLNDFITGALGCERGRAIVPALRRLLTEARTHDIPVLYANDSHLKGIDHELTLWGDHALRGTEGAEVIPELAPQANDYVVLKRRYSGFFRTDLDLLLRELEVDTLIITGMHAHMCCRHTAADAYCLGYHLVVPEETTDAFTEEDFLSGIRYMKEAYGAEVCSLDELLHRL